MSYDVIIIGAGWSGVIAAYDLSQKGYSIMVLEARDRVGGRAKTHVKGMHVPIDLGCSWIHGFKEGNPAKEIAKQFGVKATLFSPTETVIYGTDGPLPDEIASTLQSNLASARAAAYNETQSSSQAPGSSIPLSQSLFSPNSVLFKSCNESLAASYARSLEVPLGVPLESVSLRWTGWENSFAGSDAAPENGFQSLVEKVLDAAVKNGAKVKLGERAGAVKDTQGGVTVLTNQGEYHARTVLCTVPLGVLQHNTPIFLPVLPPRRLETIARTHVGALEKICLVYKEAWWPKASSIGSFTFLPHKSLPPTQGATDPLTILLSHTISVASFAAPLIPNPHSTMLFYISSTPAHLLAKFSDEEVCRAAHAFLLERFKATTSACLPTAYVRTNWLEDPYSRGATTTPSIIGEGRSPLDFLELGQPLWEGKLGFAGEHTEPNHRGSVAGAVISGQREAVRIGRLLAKEKGEM